MNISYSSEHMIISKLGSAYEYMHILYSSFDGDINNLGGLITI